MPDRYDRARDRLFTELSFMKHVCAKFCLKRDQKIEFDLARNSQSVTFISSSIRLLSKSVKMEKKTTQKISH